jgi:Protein of Unknown function (DUF2784)
MTVFINQVYARWCVWYCILMAKNSHRYLFLARLILAFHVWVMVLFWLGAWYSFGHHWYAPIHLVEVAFVIGLRQVMHGDCILTLWEQKYLKLAGKKSYGNSCYNQYLFKKFFGLTLTGNQVKWFLIVCKIVPSLTPVVLLFR